MNIKKPICPYCNQASELTNGSVIYPHRKDLYHLNFYLCKQCDAYVGTHKGTIAPLGRLATKELRQAKSKAHKAFDPLWRDGLMSRRQAYKWLSETLHISADECHIGMFDIASCELTASESLKKQIELYS